MQYIRLIRQNPDFAKLWVAQVISLMGDWFNTIVLSALIAKFTEGTSYQGLAVSGYLLARLIPPLVVSPIAGVMADRFNRKHLLIASDGLRAIIVFLMLTATHGPETLWLIYLLTILQFLVSSVFDPARNAIMPSLLHRDDLVIGNTLSSVTWSVMLAVGAIIGGIVASLFGIQVALIIDALTFLLSAVFIIRIRMPEKALYSDLDNTNEQQEYEVDKSKRTFREGLRYLFRHPATAAAIFVKTGISVGSIDAVLIIYGTKLFVLGEGGTTSMAILWGAFGLGAIIGPMITNRFSDGSVSRLRHLVIVGFVTMVIGWLLFGSAESLLFASIALAIRGMGGSVNWTYSSVIIQKIVPDAFLGRMFSLDFAGFQLMQGISTLVVGLLIDAVGNENVRQIVIATGLLLIIPTLIWIATVYWLDRGEKQKLNPSLTRG